MIQHFQNIIQTQIINFNNKLTNHPLATMRTVQALLTFCLLLLLTTSSTPSPSPSDPIPTTTTPNSFKSYLTTIKKELRFIYFIFEEKCYSQYVSTYDFYAPSTCYLLSISRLLSVLVFAITVVLRVPQIIKNVNQRSVEGLSFVGNNFQFMMSALITSYGIYKNLPLQIYGENILLIVQNMIVLMLFFFFSNQSKVNLLIYLFVSVSISAMLLAQLMPPFIMDNSMQIYGLAFIIARGSQAFENYRNKSTGTLSIISYLISCFSNVSRTFCTLVQTPEQLEYLLGSCLIPFIINFYIFLQFFFYPSIQKQQADPQPPLQQPLQSKKESESSQKGEYNPQICSQQPQKPNPTLKYSKSQ